MICIVELEISKTREPISKTSRKHPPQPNFEKLLRHFNAAEIKRQCLVRAFTSQWTKRNTVSSTSCSIGFIRLCTQQLILGAVFNAIWLFWKVHSILKKGNWKVNGKFFFFAMEKRQLAGSSYIPKIPYNLQRSVSNIQSTAQQQQQRQTTQEAWLNNIGILPIILLHIIWQDFRKRSYYWILLNIIEYYWVFLAWS
jgi:hypothetical protein